MTELEWLPGNKPIEKRLNIASELKRLANNPLSPLLTKIRTDHKPGSLFFSDEVSRYADAYSFYYLSLERFLPALGCFLQVKKCPIYYRKSTHFEKNNIKIIIKKGTTLLSKRSPFLSSAKSG